MLPFIKYQNLAFKVAFLAYLVPYYCDALSCKMHDDRF